MHSDNMYYAQLQVNYELYNIKSYITLLYTTFPFYDFYCIQMINSSS